MNVLVTAGSYCFTDHLSYGEGLQAQAVVRALSSHGVRVHVLSPNFALKRPIPGLMMTRVGRYSNLTSSDLLWGPFNFAISSYIRTKTLLKTEDFDVIHHMFPVSYPRTLSFVLLDPSLKSRYKMIVGPCPMPPESHSNRVVERAMNRSLGGLFAKTMQNADVVLVQNRSAEFLYSTIVNPEKIRVVPLGVDTQRFTPKVRLLDEASPEILTVGNLIPSRGVAYLIEAIGIVAMTHPNIILHVIGDGPERSRLLLLRDKMKLSENVLFHGRMANSELPAWYQRCSVFCLPSIAESFGVVLLEAMAAGAAVVATRTVGSNEIIDDERTGLLVEPADAPSLANGINRVLGDSSLRTALGIAARASCVRRFDLHSVVKRYLEVYQELTSQQVGPTHYE